MLSKLRKLDVAIIVLALCTLASYLFFREDFFGLLLWLTVILAIIRVLGIVRPYGRATLSKLRKLDAAIALSALWTIVCYFFFQHGTFVFFLWLTIILAALRLLGIVRRRVLWKIRNRLIISALFFIVTPIVLITVFFYLITNIIIYQYNSAIFDNLMQNEIRGFEESGDYYLGLANEGRILQEVQRFQSRRPRFLHIAFFRAAPGAGGRLQAFFAYPEDLPLKTLDPNGPLGQLTDSKPVL
jgi:hypothetical protein